MCRLLLLTLLCAGCGSSATDSAFVPTQAQASVPQAVVQARHLVATLDTGGQAGLVLTQAGSLVSGRAVLNRGEEKLPMQINGSLEGSRASLRLTPDSHATGTRTIVITGEVGGAGRWSDRAARTSGNLTLTEAEPIRERTGLALEQTLTIEVPSLNVTIQCTPKRYSPATGGYLGSWQSSQYLGGITFLANAGEFSATLDPRGEVSVNLFQVGALQFPKPEPDRPVRLNPESDLLFDGQGVPLTGTVTVAK
jgi:hypothetical protein